jgi:hypothetical protein
VHQPPHEKQADPRIDGLAHQKVIRRTIARACNNGRRTEDHEQAGDDKQQRNAENPFIDADPLRHSRLCLSARRSGVERERLHRLLELFAAIFIVEELVKG